MKKQILIIGVFALSLALFAQQLTHESLVINIEVPVRVFKGSTFVDNLTIDDFEVYEDGKLQKIEAVYLIRKTKIERKEEKKKFTPETSRNFYLFFEITEYIPRLEKALSYFFQNVLVPGDNLTVVTPLKTYNMKKETFEVLPEEEIVKQLKGILRRDTLISSSEYRSIVDELSGLARALSSVFGGDAGMLDDITGSGYEMEGGVKVEVLLSLYASALQRLDNLRSIDQRRLLEFAEFLKDKKGQKYVFLFYQREFIPQIEPRLLTQALSAYQAQPNILSTVLTLFSYHKRDISIDVNQVKQAYADSSIAIHFLFFTKPAEHIRGVHMEESSGDIFATFMEMAKATGGSTESSANPDFLFKRAGEASENYYLVYYAPINYKRDGKFKNIKVKVKNKNYRILHRAGYFAN